MERLLRCDCGFEVRAADDAEFVAEVQRHALEAHGMRFTADEVLRLARHVESSKAPQEQPPCSPRCGSEAGNRPPKEE
jgi:predicted small metal-binding protein